jgi:hypothetical protein
LEAVVDDRDIVASMVKGREFCRRLVREYEELRVREADSGGKPDVKLLRLLNAVVSKMVATVRQIPVRFVETMSGDSDRAYARRALAEVTALLERAIMLEREMRRRVENSGDGAMRRPAERLLNSYKSAVYPQ